MEAVVKKITKKESIGERDRHKAGPAIRLLDKDEVLAVVGVSYTTLWGWMVAGRFPKPRVAGGHAKSKSLWRSDEIAAWLDALPQRRLKSPDEAA